MPRAQASHGLRDAQAEQQQQRQQRQQQQQQQQPPLHHQLLRQPDQQQQAAQPSEPPLPIVKQEQESEQDSEQEPEHASDEEQQQLPQQQGQQAQPHRVRLTSKQFVPDVTIPDLEEAFAQSMLAAHPAECLAFQEACDNPDIERTIEEFLKFDGDQDGTATRIWPELLVRAFPELNGKPLRTMLSLMVARTFKNRYSHTLPLRQCVEFFAGRAQLTYAHLERGLCCTRFDKDYGAEHNCLEQAGLRRWLNELCFADEGALVWLGTQCSSFLTMCRKQSQRQASNGFLGDVTKEFVRQGNSQMEVSSLIWFLAWLGQCQPFLEQPLSSVLPKLRPLTTVLQFTSAIRSTTWHGAFGGESAKPLQMWHIDERYGRLMRPRPRNLKALTTRAVRPDGRVAYSGKSKLMKASQTYTVHFGRAVASITCERLRGCTQDEADAQLLQSYDDDAPLL